MTDRTLFPAGPQTLFRRRAETRKAPAAAPRSRRAAADDVGTRPEAAAPRLPVSVVIPVRNEAKNLPACLSRLGAFAEIVVVDSASTDETVAIAEAAGARVIDFAWNGRYPKKRNHVLLTETLAAPWVLFLDADEQVSEAFVAELASVLPQTPHAGFWLNYTNHFAGRPLRYGVPQRKLALFRVGAGLYERIEEESWSHLDMEIHEHPVIDGSIGEIDARIDHRDFRGLEKFLARHVDYARWEVHRHASVMAAGLDALPPLTSRQRFKYRCLKSWWYPWFYFALTYGAKRGFLDGAAGFSYAFFKAWYFYTIRGLIGEQERGTAERITRTLPASRKGQPPCTASTKAANASSSPAVPDFSAPTFATSSSARGTRFCASTTSSPAPSATSTTFTIMPGSSSCGTT